MAQKLRLALSPIGYWQVEMVSPETFLFHAHSLLCFALLNCCPARRPSTRSVILCVDQPERTVCPSTRYTNRYVTATIGVAPLAQHKHRVLS